MTTEKRIRSIKIDNDFNTVSIRFINTIPRESETEEEDEEGDNLKSHEYLVIGKNRPHADFIDSFKKLRKFALEALEINLNASSDTAKFTVNALKISGDMLLNQSRVIMTLAKKVDWSGKVAEIKTPQITMYPKQDETKRFHNSEKMTEQIEKVIGEAWAYLNGKSEEEQQLPLFPQEAKLTTHFTQ